MELNSQQKQAVEHAKGPLLIFAGAGSGKTRVITYRIAWLIEQRIAEPEQILAVTFTRKAAGEMKERILRLLSGQHQGALPYIGTFHSFGALLLRKEGQRLGLPVGFSIYDPDDGLHVVKEVMDDLKIDKKQYNPQTVLGNISSSKNELVSPDEYRTFVQGPFDEVVSEVYPRYEETLRARGAVDFDDLQMLPLKLLQEFPEVKKKYNDVYQFVMVDEYQDTNQVQYQLVKSLVNSHKNICVVGDDDQGIYSWRGATIKNILSFERDFPGAKVIRLEQNYRSTANILRAAHAVISNNNERAQKSLWTSEGEGVRLSLYEARNEKDEATYVVRGIEHLVRSGTSLNDIAILYRINAQSRALEEELLRNAVPYRLVGGVRFYERREIKDMLAFLRFIANPLDELSFLRVINVPPRKIGKTSIDSLRKTAKEMLGEDGSVGLLFLVLWGLTAGVTDWDEYFPGLDVDAEAVDGLLERDEIQKIKEKYATVISLFGKLYEAGKRERVRCLIDLIIELTGYEEWIDDGTAQAEARLENLYELKVVADRHAALGPRDSLLAFLEDVALVEQEEKSDRGNGENGDAVTLMTMHAAKGLEFDTVFMTGMEEGLFPHARSFTSPSELEEERRLCYVGITRAKRRLLLTFSENRKTYGGLSERIPSRFISEIPEDLVEFSSWNRQDDYRLS
ncbi:MAG: 3'-5' exonuclease [Candidatus Dojkabacteria bacterium]|nr:3'-5' exonuclease [Candidatus Dojkabacteria bacterium]